MVHKKYERPNGRTSGIRQTYDNKTETKCALIKRCFYVTRKNSFIHFVFSRASPIIATQTRRNRKRTKKKWIAVVLSSSNNEQCSASVCAMKKLAIIITKWIDNSDGTNEMWREKKKKQEQRAHYSQPVCGDVVVVHNRPSCTTFFKIIFSAFAVQNCFSSSHPSHFRFEWFLFGWWWPAEAVWRQIVLASKKTRTKLFHS